MNIKSLHLVIVLFQNFSSTYAQNLYPFTLEGKIQGKDSGFVYLNYRQSGDKVVTDSCMLKNGYFLIDGFILEPTLANFSTFNYLNPSSVQDERNSTEFYIESANMKLIAISNQFNTLKLTGSSTDSDRIKLLNTKMPIDVIENPILDIRKKYISEYRSETKSGSNPQLVKMLYQKIDSLDKELKPLDKKEALIDSLFIIQNPNSFVAISMLWLNTQVKTIAFPSLENLYLKFSNKIQESQVGKKIAHEIEKEGNTNIGKFAHNFIAIDSKGDTIRLYDYKGRKYILLSFGASWCAPCRRMVPDLKMEYAKYSSGLEIIGITNQDQVDDWKKAIIDDNIEWPQILENKNQMPIEPKNRTISDLYFIDLIPSMLLIDKDAKIIGKYGGFYSSKSSYLGDLNQKLIEIFEK